MKHTHPIERAIRIIIVIVFALTTILSLASCGSNSYSPLDTYIVGQNQKYADSTRYAHEAKAWLDSHNIK